MTQTFFRSEVRNGPIDNLGVTISMIADDTSVALWGPVILVDSPVSAVTELPQAGSVASAGSVLVFGICVKLTRSGTVTADVSPIEVLIWGIGKAIISDTDIAMNDPIETSATAGEAQKQPSTEISTEYDKADEVEAFNNIRASFAIALTDAVSGADSVIAVFVNIVPGVRVTAEA